MEEKLISNYEGMVWVMEWKVIAEGYGEIHYNKEYCGMSE